MQQSLMFPSCLFWDVDINKLNFNEKADFVIERVFERGDVEDIRRCRSYYGDDKIRQALTSAKWLSPETVYLAIALLNNKLTDYRCYIAEQSNPQPWSY
ncbi:MAG: hypothetical protein LBN18_09030 [Dysgonamonadaceae bacterium]|jgi:hypothetical protein|nr:hypothetical protein [Dysgonamonadaceae bacterium]